MIWSRRLTLLTVWAALGLMAAPAWAEMYRWTDDQGGVHYTQGLDTAVVVGVLGAFWGLLYLKRRSVIAPMVNHAAFDAIQVVAALLLSRSIRA